MEIKCKKLTETAILPKRQTNGSAGYDLCGDNDERILVMPHETVMIPTNVAMAIPKGYAGLIFARSGLSVKKGLRPATCVSVIDSDYRGNVGLPIHNDGCDPQVIEPRDRISQLVIMKVEDFDFIAVDSLDDTERGVGGFGSTGR